MSTAATSATSTVTDGAINADVMRLFVADVDEVLSTAGRWIRATYPYLDGARGYEAKVDKIQPHFIANWTRNNLGIYYTSAPEETQKKLDALMEGSGSTELKEKRVYCVHAVILIDLLNELLKDPDLVTCLLRSRV